MLELCSSYSSVEIDWVPERAHLRKALWGYWVIEYIFPQDWLGSLYSQHKSDALIFASNNTTSAPLPLYSFSEMGKPVLWHLLCTMHHLEKKRKNPLLAKSTVWGEEI